MNDLRNWATPFEADCLDAVDLHGSFTAAGEALGVHRSTVQRAIERARARAEADQPLFPNGPVEQGRLEHFVTKRVSTNYDSEGKVNQQWVIGVLDAEQRQEALRAAAAAMAEKLPRQEPITPPAMTSSSLCNLYTYTDYHMGMLAWHKEGGADWDLKIAEKLLLDSFMGMLALSPDAETCIVNIQGDFLHTDGLLPLTPASKHVLDTDGRFSKIVAAAIRVLRKVINAALSKHKQVKLVICEGNHDESSTVWMRHMFAALYEDEPRLTVNDSELPFYVETFGSSMIAFHHGHKIKLESMPLLFAAQFPREWGDATYRYGNCGHYHHVDERELTGMLVVRHPTLSARDAYASRHGYISERAAMVQTFHKRIGRVLSNYLRPEMFQSEAA